MAKSVNRAVSTLPMPQQTKQNKDEVQALRNIPNMPQGRPNLRLNSNRTKRRTAGRNLLIARRVLDGTTRRVAVDPALKQYAQ